VVGRNDEVGLGVYRGSVGELVRSERVSCSMSWLCTGCQVPVEECSGSLLPAGIVYMKAMVCAW
jgi:hypothetical protein